MTSSFLKRIERAADPTSAERQFYRGEDLEAAVLENLRGVLNTRQGASPSAPDYGTPDLSELVHDFPESLSLMQRSVKNTILKYETRLKNVQVRLIEREEGGSPILVHFEITAQLVYANGDRQPFRFSTTIDHTSAVTLE